MAYINMNKKIYKEEEIKELREKKEEKKKKKKEEKKGEKNENKKSISESGTSQYYDKYNDEFGKEYDIPKNVKFGMHINDSFFEVYCREIVYQLFDYSIMKCMKYDFSLGNADNKKNIIEDKNDVKINKIEIIDMNIDNLKYEPKLDNNSVELKKEEETNIKNNKIKENVKNEYTIKVNLRQANIEKKKDKKYKKEALGERFIRDFDFILPGLKVEILAKVLNNKEISPFLFHKYIDLEK